MTDHHKRRRIPEERPAQILEAAFEVFAERGLADARLDDIARAAGIAKGTIYLYFPNKEALFHEMVRSTMVARLDEAERHLDAHQADTATEQLRSFVAHWWEYLCCPRFQSVYRLLLAELQRFPDLAQFYAKEVVLRSRSLVCRILRHGIERGEFRAHDPEVAARMLSSMLVAHSLWVGKPTFQTLAARTHDQVREEILEFFLAGIAPVSAPALAASASHDRSA